MTTAKMAYCTDYMKSKFHIWGTAAANDAAAAAVDDGNDDGISLKYIELTALQKKLKSSQCRHAEPIPGHT